MRLRQSGWARFLWTYWRKRIPCRWANSLPDSFSVPTGTRDLQPWNAPIKIQYSPRLVSSRKDVSGKARSSYSSVRCSLCVPCFFPACQDIRPCIRGLDLLGNRLSRLHLSGQSIAFPAIAGSTGKMSLQKIAPKPRVRD